MSAAETMAFAVAWVALAALLAWSILRGPGGRWPRPGGAAPAVDLRASPAVTVAAPERWLTVETLDGSGPEVVAVGDLLVAAALAARGLDPAVLAPGDVRVEVADDIDGSEVTRFLVRTRVLVRPTAS